MLISSEQNDPHQILTEGFVWLFQTYVHVIKWRE